MIPHSLAELAAITAGRPVVADGRAPDSIVIDGTVHTDSRSIAAGDVYVARAGAALDGHDFAAAAVAAGAALLVVERELDTAAPQLVVADAVTALADLARTVVARVRARGRLTVVAMTGSNGKTTTKNLLGAIFAAEGETLAPQDSYNNFVGAPLAMLRITEDCEYLVVEMGADKIGDIRHLTGIVTPDVAIELKVGLAHVGGFGSIENTAIAKGELVEALGADDTAVLNADDPRVVAMAARTTASVVWFGTGALPGPGWRARDVVADADGIRFEAVAGDGTRVPIVAPLVGEHHVANVLAALTAATAAGVDVHRAAAAIAAAPRPKWRMELLARPDGVTVINDAYNSSPDSLAAALRTLAQLAEGRRTIAVLGEMLELGDESGSEHDRIGELVVRLDISRLVVVGNGARRMHLAAGMEGSWDGESVFAADADEAERLLADLIVEGDVVLVKSSYGAGLRHLGDRIAGVTR